MSSPPPQPPEGELLEKLRVKRGLSRRTAASAAGISDTWWREVVQGYRKSGDRQFVIQRAAPSTLARMGQVVGAMPEQLRAAGRSDAADLMEHLGDEFAAERVEGVRKQLDTTGLTDAECSALQAFIDVIRASRLPPATREV